MKVNDIVSIAMISCVAACAGEPAKDPTTPQPSASASATAQAPAAESERAKTGAKYLKSSTDAVGAGQQGRVAASGLSEPIFGLPKDVREGLAAITSDAIDPSQSARIVGAMFDGSLGPATEKACGQPVQKVLKAMQGVGIPDRGAFVIKTCGLDATFDATIGKNSNPAFILLSAGVLQLLKDGNASEAELGLAKLLANFGRTDG